MKGKVKNILLKDKTKEEKKYKENKDKRNPDGLVAEIVIDNFCLCLYF